VADRLTVEQWLAAAVADTRDAAVGSAELAASALRSAIAVGRLRPGSHLAEDQLSKALGISRNTLREAFRTLGLEGLVEHFPNRGVFVRMVDEADIDDIYLIRTTLETSALDIAAKLPAVDLHRLTTVIGLATTAARDGDWAAVGRHDIEFHRAIVALAGSPRLDAAIDRVLAELQLVFYAVDDEPSFYQRYVDRNATIAELIVAGEWSDARKELRRYLRNSRADAGLHSSGV
jgi:DNA-binding GntR family transcriptional regulator